MKPPLFYHEFYSIKITSYLRNVKRFSVHAGNVIRKDVPKAQSNLRFISLFAQLIGLRVIVINVEVSTGVKSRVFGFGKFNVLWVIYYNKSIYYYVISFKMAWHRILTKRQEQNASLDRHGTLEGQRHQHEYEQA